MANMFPEHGPIKPKTSPAESKLYALLRTALDDKYLVFHGVTWQSRDREGKVQNGEVDFILAHPTKGILLLEVKGGGITFDGTTGLWSSRDRYGKIYVIKPPFDQVSTSMHQLWRHLREAVVTKSFAYEYQLGYGVWFPDSEWPRGTVGLPSINDDLVLDIRDLSRPSAGLDRLFAYFKKNRRRLSDEALNAFRNMLAPTIQTGLTLRTRIEQDQPLFAQLTEEQFRRLEMMNRYSRVRVRGSAGTGKTVLAIDKARRLAGNALDVLYLTTSTNLAESVQDVLSRLPSDIAEHIMVNTLEELCHRIERLARIPFIESERAEYVKLVGALSRRMDVVERRGTLPQYDAILIDEAQEFGGYPWTPLYHLLRDRRDGLVYVFYDPGQAEDEINRIDDEWAPRLAGSPKDLRLTDNIRNTQAISQFAQQYYWGGDEPICRGPEGKPVNVVDPRELVEGDTPTEQLHLKAVEVKLDLLIDKEGVQPEEILIVTCETQERSLLYNARTIGRHQLSHRVVGVQDGVVALTSVRAARGLEYKAVIITELGGIEHQSDRAHDTYLYIAASRAMHYLIMLGTKDQCKPRKST